jgi:cell division protein FtsW (lipid II flippase)
VNAESDRNFDPEAVKTRSKDQRDLDACALLPEKNKMDLYIHIRIVVSILVGFSLTHLLKGAARLVQHPGRERVYWVHLVWVWFMFFYLIIFWWWEFRLGQISSWTLPLYLFVIVYGVLLYLLCALLFPDDVREYNGFRDYFYSRRRWFFGVLASLWIVDFYDTFIKGPRICTTER